jgi:hypothetical protein
MFKKNPYIFMAKIPSKNLNIARMNLNDEKPTKK